MVSISASDWLNYFRKIRKEVLLKCKESHQKFGKEKFFGIHRKVFGKSLRKVSKIWPLVSACFQSVCIVSCYAQLRDWLAKKRSESNNEV